MVGDASDSGVLVTPDASALMERRRNESTFRELSDKFVSGPDDARGYVALGLFISHHLDRNPDASYVSICSEIAALSSESAAVLYLAAAQRMLDVDFKNSAEAQIDEAAKRDKSSMLLERSVGAHVNEVRERVEEKLLAMSADLAELKTSQRVERQVVVSAASSAVVVIVILLLGSGADLLGYLRARDKTV